LKVLEIVGGEVTVWGLDALHESPLLDIKPVISWREIAQGGHNHDEGAAQHHRPGTAILLEAEAARDESHPRFAGICKMSRFQFGVHERRP
jgi:hypothetical protein